MSAIDPADLSAAPDPFALRALRIVFFTGFATVATVLGFVFMAPAGAVIALLFAWKGVETVVDPAEQDFAIRALAVLFVTGFATVATVMGFVFLPPAGLALAALFLWRGYASFGLRPRTATLGPQTDAPASTGNVAFDAYRADTLRRLEEERVNFEGFLARLREARDKAEFDQFLDDRVRNAQRSRRETAPETD